MHWTGAEHVLLLFCDLIGQQNLQVVRIYSYYVCTRGVGQGFNLLATTTGHNAGSNLSRRSQ